MWEDFFRDEDDAVIEDGVWDVSGFEHVGIVIVEVKFVEDLEELWVIDWVFKGM